MVRGRRRVGLALLASALTSGCGATFGSADHPVPFGDAGRVEHFRGSDQTPEATWEVTVTALHDGGGGSGATGSRVVTLAVRAKNTSDGSRPAGLLEGELWTDRSLAASRREDSLSPEQMDHETLGEMRRRDPLQALRPGIGCPPRHGPPPTVPSDAATDLCFAFRVPAGDRPEALGVGPPLAGNSAFLAVR